MHLNLSPKSAGEVTALRELFEHYLKCAYWTEEHLMPFYGRISERIGSRDVLAAVEKHSGSTTLQYQRLQDIFKSIGLKPSSHRFEALAHHTQRLETVLAQIPAGPVQDAAIIAELQQIIHCEIACYGTLRSFAIALKEERVVWLLEENLNDEKAFDTSLSTIAQAYVNDEAANLEF
jgi:ferritin-like metal-binding protein YciE